MSEDTNFIDLIISFFSEICQCEITIKDNKSIPIYKKGGLFDLNIINGYFLNYGFKHLKIRKYDEKGGDYSYYAIGTEKCDLSFLFNDILYRYNNYKTINDKIKSAFKGLTDNEICACFNMIYCILSELEVFTVNLDELTNITNEQRAMYNDTKILQFNNMFIPYLKNTIKLYAYDKSNVDQKFFNNLFDYLFEMYYESTPLELIEVDKNTKTKICGLKIKAKNFMLSDFVKFLCQKEVFYKLYTKKYGSKMAYLEESLKCIYNILVSLEI